jgi:Rha family phage regulatory protein
MTDLVMIKDGKPTANSKAIADFFNKNHRDVLRDISNLECSDDFRERNFARSSYKSLQNKSLPCYEMTKDGFCFLAMGFTGKEAAKWKEAFILAFNQMEEIIKSSGGMMDQINQAISIMEQDKDIASKCGKGLSAWKKVKKEHVKQIERLKDAAQLTLGFKMGE